jgi:hypothetical protein
MTDPRTPPALSNATPHPSEFQQCCLDVIRKSLNGVATSTQIRCKLKSNNLAVSSALRSLLKRGIVGRFTSSSDQWAQGVWFIRKEHTND